MEEVLKHSDKLDKSNEVQETLAQVKAVVSPLQQHDNIADMISTYILFNQKKSTRLYSL